jgi:hypothetical protein
MSRVMLFVQDGYHQSPACVGVMSRYRPGDRPAKAVRRSVDRWWIVECASAKEGRFLIASSVYCPERMEHLHGRIIASGGRS